MADLSRSENVESISGKALPLQVRYTKAKTPKLPMGMEYEFDGPLESQPQPSRGEDGVLIFEGRWKGIFTPNVTPEEMFRGGAFGGAYFWYVYFHSIKYLKG